MEGVEDGLKYRGLRRYLSSVLPIIFPIKKSKIMYWIPNENTLLGQKTIQQVQW